MKLIFINEIGSNFKGTFIYEFLFSKFNIDEVEGEDWDSVPCNNQPKPPVEYVDLALSVMLDSKIELIQKSPYFSMEDCQQGIIALGWEIDSDEYTYDNRLIFRYGEDLQKIQDKLYIRDKTFEKTYEK
jgi:hypothetical protein